MPNGNDMEPDGTETELKAEAESSVWDLWIEEELKTQNHIYILPFCFHISTSFLHL